MLMLILIQQQFNKYNYFKAEFVDVGTETQWTSDDNTFTLTARTSGNKREGIVHDLTINGILVDEISISN